MEIIERYAARWSIEVAFHEAKHLTGAGEARNRTKLTVEGTPTFGMLTQSLVIAGQPWRRVRLVPAGA